MLERWESLEENVGQQGSEGIILDDDELPGISRVTIERKIRLADSHEYYAITFGVYGWLVHTAFFEILDDAREAAVAIKLAIQAMDNAWHTTNS